MPKLLGFKPSNKAVSNESASPAVSATPKHDWGLKFLSDSESRDMIRRQRMQRPDGKALRFKEPLELTLPVAPAPEAVPAPAAAPEAVPAPAPAPEPEAIIFAPEPVPAPAPVA